MRECLAPGEHRPGAGNSLPPQEDLDFMKVPIRRARLVVGALASAAVTACAPAARQATAAAPAPVPAPVPATTRVIHESEVEFMQGMIPHHAQAVLIASWAKSHGARSDVLALCERIVVGQTDEIHLMQHWLRERGQEVPPEDAKTHKMKMNGMVHEMIMPGMLNAEQLAALDRARGSEWDRLFLEAMIGHHAGAIDMVNQLMSSPGGATDDLVYRFSADVYADQTTEIERMQKMLAATPGAKP
jgi:uncharacterized protein (DUF305 family)